MIFYSYIYVPIGGSKVGTCHQLYSSLVVFMFTYIWHGLQIKSFVWSLISFLSAFLTTAGIIIVRSPKVKTFLVGMLVLSI